MLKVYNTISNFFGKDYGYKILRTLAIYRDKPEEASDILGTTEYSYGPSYNALKMKINENILLQNTFNAQHEYDKGWFTSPHIYETFVHEFGHVIDFFHEALFPFHEKIDTFSGLANELISCITNSLKNRNIPLKFYLNIKGVIICLWKDNRLLAIL